MSQSSSAPAPNPAQTYEDYLVANQFRPWGKALLDRAQPQAGERILDVACGTGIVARLISQRLGDTVELAGLDPSPPMLEVGRARAAQEGAQITFHEGKVESLPFSDASFDLVTIQQGLQYFQDKTAGLAEIHRVLVPGGRVASITWTEIENQPFFLIFADVVRRQLGTPAVETSFAVGNRDMLQSLFTEAEFVDIDITVDQKDITFPSPDRFLELGVAGIMAAVPAMQTMSAEERQALIGAVKDEMAEPFQQFVRGNQVVISREVHIVVARKTQ